MSALSGLRVLVTRPLHMAHEFANQLRKKGGNPIIFPTMTIEFLVKQSDCEKLYNELQDYQLLIFTSQNAVLALTDVLKKIAIQSSDQLTIAAIGDATAQKLKALGLSVNFVPQKNYTSEDFMEEFLSKINENTRVAIIKGEGGRTYLTQELGKITSNLKEFSIYRRLPSKNESNWLEKLLKNQCIDVLVVLSQETLNNLLENEFSLYNIELYKLPLFVPSERIRDYAQKLGFINVKVVGKINSEMLLNELIKWRNKI